MAYKVLRLQILHKTTHNLTIQVQCSNHCPTVPSVIWKHKIILIKSLPSIIDSGITARGVGAGAPPLLTLLIRKFLLSYQEKRGKEKRKRKSGEEKENQKGKVENYKLQNKEWGDDLFFLFFFQNHWIFCGSTKMGIFYQKKSISRREKKIRKNDWPLWKIFLLRLWSLTSKLTLLGRWNVVLHIRASYDTYLISFSVTAPYNHKSERTISTSLLNRLTDLAITTFSGSL